MVDTCYNYSYISISDVALFLADFISLQTKVSWECPGNKTSSKLQIFVTFCWVQDKMQVVLRFTGSFHDDFINQSHWCLTFSLPLHHQFTMRNWLSFPKLICFNFCNLIPKKWSVQHEDFNIVDRWNQTETYISVLGEMNQAMPAMPMLILVSNNLIATSLLILLLESWWLHGCRLWPPTSNNSPPMVVTWPDQVSWLRALVKEITVSRQSVLWYINHQEIVAS